MSTMQVKRDSLEAGKAIRQASKQTIYQTPNYRVAPLPMIGTWAASYHIYLHRRTATFPIQPHPSTNLAQHSRAQHSLAQMTISIPYLSLVYTVQYIHYLVINPNPKTMLHASISIPNIDLDNPRTRLITVYSLPRHLPYCRLSKYIPTIHAKSPTFWKA